MKRTVIVLFLAWGCGPAKVGRARAEGSKRPSAAHYANTTNAIQHVFVVAMENQDASTLYGFDPSQAPYITGTLMTQYAYATNYGDDISGSVPSEPHYIWMDAGTNAFSDATFRTDFDPSLSNSTLSTSHLTTQLEAVGLNWMAYQEGLPAPCPVKSSRASHYAAKHNPFVFFRDVSFTEGKPDANNGHCAEHHRDFSQLAVDLSGDPSQVAAYNFITPNLCNDMHGQFGCSNGCVVDSPGSPACVTPGDAWLATNLPAMIDFAAANQGVIFIVWDEPEETSHAPFFVVSPHLQAAGTSNDTAYSHSSLVKSLDRIFNLPILETVSDAGINDFSGFFADGYFP